MFLAFSLHWDPPWFYRSNFPNFPELQQLIFLKFAFCHARWRALDAVQTALPATRQNGVQGVAR